MNSIPLSLPKGIIIFLLVFFCLDEAKAYSGIKSPTYSSLNPNGMSLTILSDKSSAGINDVNSTSVELNCAIPIIIISGEDSACLNAPAIIHLSASVDGNPGVGVWSGPGIIDTLLGLFDPVISGPGQHQVVFTTVFNGVTYSETYVITVFDFLTANFLMDAEVCLAGTEFVKYTGNASAGAIFDFDFGSAIIIAGSGNGPYQLRWNTPGHKIVSLQVSENGCVSEVVSHTINVIDELKPPTIDCEQDSNSVIFTYIVDPQAIYMDINPLTGQSNISINNTIIFTGLDSGEIVQIETITFSAGHCPPRRDTFSCAAKTCPIPNIVISPESDVCLYPGTVPFNLKVTVTGGNGIGDWSGTGITDVVNGKFDPVIAGAGSHVITYHYQEDDCDFTKSITINVFDPPQAVISNASLVLTCAGGNVLLLDGSASSGGAILYQWSTTTGVINSGATTSMAQVGKEGVYQLKVTHSISGCIDSVSVTVIKDANTPNADAGSDKVITCDSVTFELGGSSSTGANLIYSWTTTGGHIVGLTDGISIIVDEDGQYDIVVKDTSSGCQSTDRTIVTIDTALTSILLTPGDMIDCNTTISGVQSTLGTPVVDYDFFWSTVDGLIVGSNTKPDIDVSKGGTYVLKIHNKNNGCETTASADVPESNLIIAEVDVSLMNSTCYGDDNGALMINGVIGGIGPYTYQWSVSPTGGISLSSLSPGQYSLTVTDQNGCSFTKIFNIIEPIQITVDLGDDRVVGEGDSVKIDLITNIIPNAINQIEWGGYDGLTCPGCPRLEFIASTSGNVTAIVTDTAGCTASDSMHLTVILPRIVFIPTVFSPNGDGRNDYFFISGRQNLIKIGYLRIYDRWGNLLFNKIDGTPGVDTDGWDGTFDGKPLLPGVYVYAAELQYEDLSETIKGGITIIR